MTEIAKALFRTLLESLDSKRSMTGLVTALAATLSLVAGRQGWTWLTPELSDKIATVLVLKGAVVVASHMVPSKPAGPAVTVQTTTGTTIEASKN
jgi:hypothetical protein